MGWAMLPVLLVAAILAGCGDQGVAASPPSGARDGEYWQIADHLQRALEPSWDARSGRYEGAPAVVINGQMLVTHALAALYDHRGPARKDARARAIVRLLVGSPPYAERTPAIPLTSMSHAPGWSTALAGRGGQQHPVFETQVVDGLVAAWRARAALRLRPWLVRRIAHEIAATARGSFYRWPAIRLNQFNWNADLMAAAATVAGSRRITRELPLYLRRFVGMVAPAPGWTGNLGPGLRFHYNPATPVGDPHNLDSAEYASIVWTFSIPYRQARRAGMRRPRPRDLRLLREWALRDLSGYWTHGGYLNWDTGFGFRRWHEAKKFAIAQTSLIGLATARDLQPTRRFGHWAKWLFDRSLRLYDRWVTECHDGLPPPLLFGVRAGSQRPCDAALAAARIESNAARAVDAGLGRMQGVRPPALYAFDPDIGRLAVTTPSYNTAVIAVNQRAFPYGGLDLARLYDGDQQVVAGIGGRPPAAFGLVARDRAGHRVLATQLGRAHVRRDVTPLRLLQAPRGAGATATAAPRRAFAGPFTSLRATGTTRSGPLFARVSHRFTAEAIETRWIIRRRGTRPYSAEVLFPSTGRGATARMLLPGGRTVRLDRRRRAFVPGASLLIRSRDSGYIVTPTSAPAGATVRLLHPRRQSSAPEAGPTVAIGLAATSRFTRRALTARLVIDPSR